MSSIIAISLGRALGIAAGDAGVAITLSGNNGPGALTDVLDRACNSLSSPTVVVNAKPAERAPGAVTAHREALAVVTAFCDANGLELVAVDVDEVRELWTGQPKADGDAMAAEARRREFGEADAASALALALMHSRLVATAA